LYILLSKGFLKNLDIIGMRLIGRYDVISVGVFPVWVSLGFPLSACFKAVGQYASMRMAFSMYRRLGDLCVAFPLTCVQ
jgi:hypothetical protein